MREIRWVEFDAGTEIEEAVRDACSYAKRWNCIVRFRFNGVELEVDTSSDVEKKVEEYLEKLKTVSYTHLTLPTKRIV